MTRKEMAVTYLTAVMILAMAYSVAVLWIQGDAPMTSGDKSFCIVFGTVIINILAFFATATINWVLSE